MHLGNGAITPECAMLGIGAAAAGLSYLSRDYLGFVSRATQARPVSVLKVAALGTFVFAVQMINVPVLATSSAHLVGGVLLAELLGPAVGAATMAVVLVAQAVLLGDGGISALGVNILNMGVLPALVLTAVKQWQLTRAVTTGSAASLAVVVAVVAIGAEVALFRSASELMTWREFMKLMVIAHLPLIVLEACATVALVEIVDYLLNREPAVTRRAFASVLAASLVLIAMAGFVSSDLPDGYESAALTSRLPLGLEEAVR